MREFLSYIAIFEIVTDIYDTLIGSALVFGALKWKKGLLSTVACYWGIVLGFFAGFLIAYNMDTDIMVMVIIFTIVMGAVFFPMLTYTVPAINRFVLGFLVTMKLLYMFTTYLYREERNIDLQTAIFMPLIVATVFGVLFMFLRELSVLPFALGCAFLGASQVVPTITKYINQLKFGITHDYSILFDPVDFIFALFKIELTDGMTLFFMAVLMFIGVFLQLNNIKKQGYTYDTPIIVFETENKDMHGKIK